MRNGLHPFLGIPCLAILSGCSNGKFDTANLFPSIPDVINARNWEGQPLQSAVAEFGEPTDFVEDSSGHPVARWRYIRTWSSSTSYNTLSAGPGPGGVTVTPNSVQSSSPLESRLELSFERGGDQSNTITNFKTWKSYPGGCNDYSFARPGS
ncbi:hypothetical protein HNP46_004607 [Pseudomonas nitritireducens]|uniref:Uncharacterized protein n=1 Tax=Pseudomonas nitroreducens TaxID=46680 RepID=A0A7W7KMW1_PSENT|nr:hypothetical protein [Pseudomonas nitritireducens]MBB4865706.1 hypothetical protein [Pseudomonas nitritireducens]